MTMAPAVEMDRVFFSYPNIIVLSNVSLTIQTGEFIGIIGPNGGGKTTLLKLMMGFLKPSKGKVHILGKAPWNHPQVQQQMAYVPQTTRFDRQFPISVLEVVLSGLLSKLPWYGQFSAKDRQAALDALDEVNLVHCAECAFGTLSGGQAQRVLIARALISKPRILLLDEPTASVDNQAEADIYALLERLKGHMTIIMVTHDLRAAIDHVQRVLCVQNNVLSLAPQDVCEHFAIGLYHPPLLQDNITKNSTKRSK